MGCGLAGWGWIVGEKGKEGGGERMEGGKVGRLDCGGGGRGGSDGEGGEGPMARVTVPKSLFHSQSAASEVVC